MINATSTEHTNRSQMTAPVPRISEGGHVGQVDATKMPRFAGPATFARLPRIDEVSRADAAVLGVRHLPAGREVRPVAHQGVVQAAQAL
jgi:guanidinobutyrase / D-arginase